MTWNELYEQCRICDKCPLGKTKTNTVFGCGNQNARLMFVGEAPGEQEDKQGIPFVGAAGKLLDKYLDAVEILRDEVYIANILKCRPPHNRDPLPEEGRRVYRIFARTGEADTTGDYCLSRKNIGNASYQTRLQDNA